MKLTEKLSVLAEAQKDKFVFSLLCAVLVSHLETRMFKWASVTPK